METEIIDKLFLELSQVTGAKTKKELRMIKALKFIRNGISDISNFGHNNNYDWNADPHFLTKIESDIFTEIYDSLNFDEI